MVQKRRQRLNLNGEEAGDSPLREGIHQPLRQAQVGNCELVTVDAVSLGAKDHLPVVFVKNLLIYLLQMLLEWRLCEGAPLEALEGLLTENGGRGTSSNRRDNKLTAPLSAPRGAEAGRMRRGCRHLKQGLSGGGGQVEGGDADDGGHGCCG